MSNIKQPVVILNGARAVTSSFYLPSEVRGDIVYGPIEDYNCIRHLPQQTNTTQLVVSIASVKYTHSLIIIMF